MPKPIMTKRIYFTTMNKHIMTLDCQPGTDFLEFYVGSTYIAKVNINKLSKDAKKELKIRTEDII